MFLSSGKVARNGVSLLLNATATGAYDIAFYFYFWIVFIYLSQDPTNPAACSLTVEPTISYPGVKTCQFKVKLLADSSRTTWY